MFEDLIRENGKPKTDCPNCSSVAVMHYNLEKHYDYKRKYIQGYWQTSYCIKCGKKWSIKYDSKMNIKEIDIWRPL